MSRISTLASRDAVRNLPVKPYLYRNLQEKTPFKAIRRKPSNCSYGSSQSTGTCSTLESQLQNPDLVLISSSPVSAVKHKVCANKPVDHQYISEILSKEDWFLLLKHQLKANRIFLNSYFVASVLQNQENPSHVLNFYVWVLNMDPSFSRNQSVRCILAHVLYRKGPVLLSVEFLKAIRESQGRITEDLICILIGSWGRLGLAKYCSDIFAQVSFLGLSPSTRLYNAVIHALVKANSLDLAYLKFHQMSIDNCSADRFTYNILIHGVCRIGVVDEALRLVKQMERLGYRPNVFTYTILIDGFCNAKRIDEACKVLETMKERHISPNEAAIRSLVHGAFRCLDPHKAFEMLLRVVEGEPLFCKLACNIILDCISSNFMSREAAKLLRHMLSKGYLLDNSTFDMTMICLIKYFHLDAVLEMFESSVELGVNPGFNTYLTLVEAIYKEGRVEEGNQVLDKMIKAGLISNVYSYNMVIHCFCKAQMMDRALESFKNMQLSGISPTLVTFNTLIDGYCKAGEVAHAQELLVMLLEKGYKPDIFTFGSIIDGLCRANKLECAFNCLTEMVEWGMSPNSFTYNILIRSLCVIGDTGKSMRLLKRMQVEGISPDAFSFNALIQSFCRRNKVKKAENLFITMCKIGLIPDNYTYSALIKALIESGRFKEAKGYFFSMEENGCDPDLYTCNLILDSLVKQAQFKEACSIVKSSNWMEQYIPKS